MNLLALDIGGANLKAADGRGFAVSLPFPLWQKPGELAGAIEQLIRDAPACERIAMTMTGELADCFLTKAEGVRAIVDAAATAAGDRPLEVYLTNGRLVTPDVAVSVELLAAASNWHVLARFVCRYVEGGPGLLVDLGSTTCDLIPLVNGKPPPAAPRSNRSSSPNFRAAVRRAGSARPRTKTARHRKSRRR